MRRTRSARSVVIESLSLQRSSAAQVDAIIVAEAEGLCGGGIDAGLKSRENRRVRSLVRQVWPAGFAAQLKTPRRLSDVAVISHIVS
jgi:hypothetical protein